MPNPTTIHSGRALTVATFSGTLTRPNNTTTYTAGDTIADTTADAHYTFTGVTAQPGKGAVIEAAVCISSVVQTTPADLELWLFSADIATTADNAAFAPSDGEAATLVGKILFPTASFAKGTVNSICTQNNLGLSFQSNNLYGALVVRNAYIPVASETFKVVLSIIQ